MPGVTFTCLCSSGLNALGMAAQAIKAGSAFGREQNIKDTTVGRRFVNPKMKELYGIEAMPQTGESVAEDYYVSREDQDLFASNSQEKAAAAPLLPA